MSHFTEVERDATLASMKKLITRRNRETKDLELEKNIYEPNLWYFDEFKLIRDGETPILGVLSFDNEDDIPD